MAIYRAVREKVGADYPFERMEDAADWYDATTTISDEERVQIGRTNAIGLFDLDLK